LGAGRDPLPPGDSLMDARRLRSVSGVLARERVVRCKSSLSGPRDRTRLYAAAVTADPGPNFPGWSQVPDHRAIRCLNRAQRKALFVQGIARRGHHSRACLPTMSRQVYSNYEPEAGQKSRLHPQVFAFLSFRTFMAFSSVDLYPLCEPFNPASGGCRIIDRPRSAPSRSRCP
jgi:hypothetical protein